MGHGPSNTFAILGAGTIGLSFAALHLTKDPHAKVVLYDPRPDLRTYVSQNIPSYLLETDIQQCLARLGFASNLEDCLRYANFVQEQGPENVDFKVKLWPEVEKYARPEALLWSSTSGIPASVQSRDMKDQSRLVVVHPYNPPHIMPLLEVVKGPETSEEVVDRTVRFWKGLGRKPVVVQKECQGFIANRLAFALLREASSLVAQGVVGVEDLDDIVTSSMGPRWSVAGPFKAYHAGGGEGGLASFMDKIGGTVQSCWDASDEDVKKGNIRVGEAWQEDVCRQAQEAYGVVDTAERDRKTRRVLTAVNVRERENVMHR